MAASASLMAAPVWEPPALLSNHSREDYQSQWAVAAAVAAVLGLPLAFVLYVCSTCQARSYDACVTAVKRWWGPGC